MQTLRVRINYLSKDNPIKLDPVEIELPLNVKVSELLPRLAEAFGLASGSSWRDAVNYSLYSDTFGHVLPDSMTIEELGLPSDDLLYISGGRQEGSRVLYASLPDLLRSGIHRYQIYLFVSAGIRICILLLVWSFIPLGSNELRTALLIGIGIYGSLELFGIGQKANEALMILRFTDPITRAESIKARIKAIRFPTEDKDKDNKKRIEDSTYKIEQKRHQELLRLIQEARIKADLEEEEAKRRGEGNK